MSKARTFNREWFNSLTNYVKANWLCGHSKTITINDIKYEWYQTPDTTHSRITKLIFDDKTSNFSKFKLSKFKGNTNYYQHFSCFNDIEDLDCQKLDFSNANWAYSRFIDGSVTDDETTESKIRIIRNLTLKNLSNNQAFAIWQLTHLEKILDCSVINSHFLIGSNIGNTSTINEITFKEGCVFYGVNIGRYNLTREASLSIIKALQTTTETRTCTLGSSNLAKLTDEDKKIATDKGWTLA